MQIANCKIQIHIRFYCQLTWKSHLLGKSQLQAKKNLKKNNFDFYIAVHFSELIKK